jgi:hypothetical protein
MSMLSTFGQAQAEQRMQNWRLAGAITFAVFALMELGDFAGLIPGFGSPASYADLTGISPREQMVRLTILSVLAVGIGVASSVTALGLFRLTRWTQLTARVTAALFIVYGVYQIVTAMVQLGKNQVGVAIAGVIYILIGIAAVWIERRASFTA